MKNSLNLQGSSLRGAQGRNAPASDIGRKFATAVKLGLLLAAFGGVCNFYIYLNQRIGDTEKNIAAIKRATVEVEREIEQRKLELAGLTRRDYIQSKIAQYNLKLRPAQYHQTRQLVLRETPSGSLGSSVKIGRR